MSNHTLPDLVGRVRQRLSPADSAGVADRDLLAEHPPLLCQGDASAAAPQDRHAPTTPHQGDHCLHCLICKGLSDAWLAILAPVGIATPYVTASGFVSPAPADTVPSASILAPRSRGPPHLV